MQQSVIFWVGFHILVLGLLAIDLFVFHNKKNVITFKKSVLLSCFWISIALIFNYFIYLYFGSTTALQFFTGYVIEKSLSVDNLFLFLMIFTHFHVPLANQHKILFWGILGVFFFRITLILLGITLINLFHWMFYLFGVVILISGGKLLWSRGKEKNILHNRVFSWIKSWLPTATSYKGDRFFIKREGKWKATPFLLFC